MDINLKIILDKKLEYNTILINGELEKAERKLNIASTLITCLGNASVGNTLIFIKF